MFFRYDILKQESPTSTQWIAAVRYIEHAQKIVAEQMRSNGCAYVIIDAESGTRHLVRPTRVTRRMAAARPATTSPL